MQLTIHNIQTIQEEGSWYKIGGEIKVDTDLDKLQIERMAQVLGIPADKLYLSPDIIDPIMLQYVGRKFVEYIIASDLDERRRQG